MSTQKKSNGEKRKRRENIHTGRRKQEQRVKIKKKN
jgi:hypothetical protein